jgi:acetyl esterase/lipase
MSSSCLHRAMTRVGVSAVVFVSAIASGAECAAGQLPPASTAALPAPLVVDVWPGPAPDDIGIVGAERTYVHDSVFVGPTRLVTDVTKPTLTIYRPPGNRNTGTAMIIGPGGGYRNLYWELEGEEVAAWLVSQGMTGIILKYRVPFRPGETRPPPGPMQDAQRAVSLVRGRAAEWGIDPNRIGMVGFSAGGHLAIATATNFDRRTYTPIDDVDRVSSRPDFAIGCYSGYLKADGKDEIPPWIRIPAGTPPILLAHASDDDEKAGGSNVENSVIMYLALRRANVPTEMHIYASGNHDFGVRQNDKLPSSWPQLALRWLRSMNLLSGGSI